MNIEGVPESITRADYLSLVAAVGLDVSRVKQLEFRGDGIYATVFAAGPNGERVVEGTECVTHRVHVPVVD